MRLPVRGRGTSIERIDHSYAATREIVHIAGCHRQPVMLGGCRNQGVHDSDREAGSPDVVHEFRPDKGHLRVKR